jgi:outer membrane protein
VKDKLFALFLSSNFLTLSCWSHAQSLIEVYHKARMYDAQFLTARSAFDAALEKTPQARAGLLPVISVAASKSLQIGEGSFSGDGYSGVPSVSREIRAWSWTAQLIQPVFRLSNWVSYAQADAQVVQANEQFALAEQELLVRAAQIYFDVQMAMQSVQVAEAQLQAIQEQLTLAQRSFEVGMGTITDVHEAKAKQALNVAQRISALNDLVAKQAELEKLVGDDIPLPPTQLAQSLPALDPIDINDWLMRAMNQNPQIRIQQAALVVAEKEVAKSMAAHAPTLDVVANRAATYNSGALSTPADLSTRVNSHQTGLQLSIPLFAGGATQSKVREAMALEKKAKDELTGAQRNASSQVRQTFAGVMNGQAQVEALEAAVEASKNSVASNKIGFKIGTRINPDVLNAEQQLYSTLRDLNKARIDAVMQSLKLKATTGSLTAEDLILLDRMMTPVAATATHLAVSSRSAH